MSLLAAYQLRGKLKTKWPSEWDMTLRKPLRQGVSEATLRWDSGAGTISGETAKRGFWYVVNEITLPTKQNALQTKKTLKINPKSYSKKECDSYSKDDQK